MIVLHLMHACGGRGVCSLGSTPWHLLHSLLPPDVIGPESLTLSWQSEDNTTFSTLLTLTTDFADPNGSECFKMW